MSDDQTPAPFGSRFDRVEAPTTAGPETRHVILLVVLVALADLWAVSHLGRGIRSLPGLATLLLVSGAAWKGVGSALSKSDKEAAANRWRAAIMWLFSPTFLTWGYWLLALTMLLVSSVQVTGERPEAGRTVTVVPLDLPSATRSASFDEDSGIVWVLVTSGPFGRSFQVSSPGYVASTFKVFPLVGRRIRLGEDLPPSPSVLFRPHPDLFPSLVAMGEFRISRLVGRDTLMIDSLALSQSSVLVGPRRSIPASLPPRWAVELQAENRDADEIAGTRLRWEKPQRMDLVDLPLGVPLLAEVYASGGQLLSSTEVVLGTDAFVDVLMSEGAR